MHEILVITNIGIHKIYEQEQVLEHVKIDK